MMKALRGQLMPLRFVPLCLSLFHCSKRNWKYFYLKAIWRRGRKHIYSLKACAFSWVKPDYKICPFILGWLVGKSLLAVQPPVISPPSEQSPDSQTFPLSFSPPLFLPKTGRHLNPGELDSFFSTESRQEGTYFSKRSAIFIPNFK